MFLSHTRVQNMQMNLFIESVIISLVLVKRIETLTQDLDKSEYVVSYSTSSIGRLKLLSLELKLQRNLGKYLGELKEKLLKLKLGLEEMRRFDINDDIEAKLSNPLYSFSLLRHMQADWPKWLQLIQMDVGEKQVKYLENKQRSIPKRNDIQEAALAILRIQETYRLSVKNIASGLLDGQQYDAKLSALDCFEIGLVHYNEQWYWKAAQWFQLVLFKYHEDGSRVCQLMGLSLTDVCLLQTKLLSKQNMQARAVRFVSHALDLLPHNMELQRLKSELVASILTLPRLPLRFVNPKSEFNVFESACRRPYVSLPRMNCHYQRTNTAFLKLAPLKLEELSLNPYIVIYHNVLYDSEIKEVQDRSKAYLQPALVASTNDSSSGIVNYIRTAEAVWMDKYESKSTLVMNQRINDMTALSTDNSEDFQVINYAIGGHFSGHYDFFNSTTEDHDRVATVLFYLTHVTQGGATVFPYINVLIYPTKGSALLWYNLDNAGFGDLNTFHSACPVIVGSKWVVSNWIDVETQIFTKPCKK